MGLLVYVVETLVGVLPVPVPFRIKSAEVLNVPVTPISVTVVEFDVDFTTPCCDPPPACVTKSPATTLCALPNVIAISVTAVSSCVEVNVAALGAAVEFCKPALSKYTTPCVEKSPDW